jgi:hypothetical protein
VARAWWRGDEVTLAILAIGFAIAKNANGP